MTRVVLDTSVLIADSAPDGVEAAISAASLAELHFGALVADDDDEGRAARCGSALSSARLRHWGSMSPWLVNGAGCQRPSPSAAALRAAGPSTSLSLRPRTFTTPSCSTHNPGDFHIIANLVDARAP